MATSGKRAGARRGTRSPRTFSPAALLTCAGITLLVIAWGYLVYAAIDFGTAARGGDGRAAWGLLVLASAGAVACLFAGLMLIARLFRMLGISQPAPAPAERSPASSASASSPSASSTSSTASGAASEPTALVGGSSRQKAARPKGGKRAAR